MSIEISSDRLVKLKPKKTYVFKGIITCVGLVIKIDNISHGIHMVHHENGHFNDDSKTKNIYFTLKGTNLLYQITF